MLEEFLIPILEVEGPNDMLFQCDGVHINFHRKVIHFLDCKFAEKWIGSGSYVTWYIVHLTLHPLIFSFRVTSRVLCETPLATTLPELDGSIRAAVATVTLGLPNMWTEIQYGYDWVTLSALIENL
jgi:hypothetical protein